MDVNVISVDVLVTPTSSKLHKPTKRLSLPDRKPLAFIGVGLQSTCDTVLQDKSCLQPVYVVKRLQQTLKAYLWGALSENIQLKVDVS